MEWIEKQTYVHNNMVLEYVNTEKGLWQIAFSPEMERKERVEGVPYPNFQIGVAGRPYGTFPALQTGYSKLPEEMQMTSVQREKDRVVFYYRHNELKLAVQVEMQFIPGTNIIRQHTTVTNEAEEPIILTHLSSLCMQGIATDGCRKWDDRKKIRLHYCLQSWQGEGQWRSADLEEMGLYRTSVHPCVNAVHLSSIGSWSTGRYLPMLVVEDMETSSVWYCQVETSASWHLELGYRSTWTDEKGGLYIKADGADERSSGWTKKLQPGESFTSVPAAVGCCKGNFTDAIRELTQYRRRSLKPQDPWKEECPVFFNDYMNCLWADPTYEKLIPLIDAASDVGAECYCIDSGWFANLGVAWMFGLGDWKPSTDRFGEDGLEGIFRYIHSKGMIPGIWLEMEVCGEDAELGKKPDSWFLMRNGKRVGGGQRWFLNFCNEEVRVYLHQVIDNLVKMGVGFIKNDYNECIGNGDDLLGSSPADGLITHIRAFYSFIDEVRTKHPHLILENCGSGAMRQDYGALSHFHLQSTSDQEIYYKYPSVILGSLAGMIPEQAGVWAYPYPLLCNDIPRPEILKSEEYRRSMADGEFTVFNMVNGICGNLYLSGRLDAADEFNRQLVREAVSLYKRERKHIHHSYPIWPLGFVRISDTDCWASIGFANEDNTRVLLAVWRLGSNEECCELPIHHWEDKNAEVKLIYPAEGFETDYSYNVRKGALTVRFSKTFQARYFEIKVRQN